MSTCKFETSSGCVKGMLLVCLSSLVLDIVFYYNRVLNVTYEQPLYRASGAKQVKKQLEKARSMLIALQLLVANG